MELQTMTYHSNIQEPNVVEYRTEALEYLIGTNYLPPKFKGSEGSVVMFKACCGELLRRIDKKRSEKRNEPFKWEQLSLF